MTASDLVPVVDMSTAKPSDVSDALLASSCLFLANHGVPSDLRRRMIDISTEFFDLPLKERELVAWDGQGVWNGWMPNGGVYSRTERTVKHPNLVEWYMAHELDTFANWPERPSGLREVWSEYYAVMADLARWVVTMVANGLDLPLDDLPAWTDQHFANLCLNHYPAQTVLPEPGQVRLSPHTDESTITILTSQDAPGGLQVRMPDRGHWTAVAFPDDTFLVQAGDLLERWTNRNVRASLHRVVNPPAEVASTAQRDTVIFFHFPALDTVVTPAAACVAASGGKGRFAPATAREHVMRRQESYAVPAEDLEATA